MSELEPKSENLVPKETIEKLLDLQKPDLEIIQGLIKKLTGVTIFEIELEAFLKNLNELREKDELKNVHKAVGKIGVYCPGGAIRSKKMGNLLNNLGFEFADKRSVRGAEITSLIQGVKVGEEVTIDGESIDTIFFLLGDDNDDRIASIAPLLQKLAGQSNSPNYSLNLIILST